MIAPAVPVYVRRPAALQASGNMGRTLDVYVDEELVTTWTSSGVANDFETIELSGTLGMTVQLRGVLERWEWLTISEVRARILAVRQIMCLLVPLRHGT